MFITDDMLQCVKNSFVGVGFPYISIYELRRLSNTYSVCIKLMFPRTCIVFIQFLSFSPGRHNFSLDRYTLWHLFTLINIQSILYIDYYLQRFTACLESSIC